MSPGDGSGAGRWLLPAVAIGTTLAPLNSTMIAVALPEIQDAFDVSVTATAWLVTLYLVAMAVGQPIGGRLGDLYGRRRVYLLGLIGFGVASLGCAFAPSLPILVLFRLLQALSGALSFPNGTAMVREAVPPERRGAAFGTVGLAAGIAAASGPPIGGVLVHAFGWSAIFWANVPVVAVALGLCWGSLPRRTVAREAGIRFDLVGSGLFAASLGAFIVIPTLLKVGQTAMAGLAGVTAAAIGVGFVRWELRTGAPVVDVRLFTRSRFAAACASIALSNLVMYTTLLALPLYLERVRGHSIQVAGVTLAALSAFSAIWGPLGGRWTDRIGLWLPAVAGAAVLLAGQRCARGRCRHDVARADRGGAGADGGGDRGLRRAGADGGGRIRVARPDGVGGGHLLHRPLHGERRRLERAGDHLHQAAGRGRRRPVHRPLRRPGRCRPHRDRRERPDRS